MKKAVLWCALGLTLLAISVSCKNDLLPSRGAAQAVVAPVAVEAAASPHPDSEKNEAADTPARKVWICQSPGAKRYHYDKDCRGLRRCTHTVNETTKDYAERVGLTVCKYEN